MSIYLQIIFLITCFFRQMKHVLFSLFLIHTIFGISQNIDIVEQPLTVCYMDDAKRPDIIAVTTIRAEVDGIDIVGFFDCSSPISEACSDALLENYVPNSISVNGKVLELGFQINGSNISRFNVGRFFSAKDGKQKYLVLEMADVDCLIVPDSYSYIIAGLDSKKAIAMHVIYTKDSNPITEEELSNVLVGMGKVTSAE